MKVAISQCECCQWGRFFRSVPVPEGTFYMLPPLGLIAVVLPRPQKGFALYGVFVKAFGHLHCFTPWRGKFGHAVVP